MEVAILTVGDEVLAGDIENTNASWLAKQLTDRGATVARILTIPDDRSLIAETVREWSEDFDAVVVTGGLGGTHDDVTAHAIADAYDTELAVEAIVRRDVLESVAAYRDLDPDTLDESDLGIDIDAWAAVPREGRALINPEGLCPGFVLGTVYAFPGVPAEMRALFDIVDEEFTGETVSRQLFTPQPEASMVETLKRFRQEFDVSVGSYPSTDGHNRLKVTGRDPAQIADATDWLCEHIDVVERD